MRKIGLALLCLVGTVAVQSQAVHDVKLIVIPKYPIQPDSTDENVMISNYLTPSDSVRIKCMVTVTDTLGLDSLWLQLIALDDSSAVMSCGWNFHEQGVLDGAVVAKYGMTTVADLGMHTFFGSLGTDLRLYGNGILTEETSNSLDP